MSAPSVCPGCGASFTTYRTGLTFAAVRGMMHTEDPPYRSKSRRAVLGFWHELKTHMFLSDHSACHATEERAA